MQSFPFLISTVMAIAVSVYGLFQTISQYSEKILCAG